MGKSNIAWCDYTWNPVTGCSKVSQGCKNCYAKTLHDMRHKAYLEGKKLPKQYSTPFEEVRCHADRLTLPLHWKKPQKIFVNSMSDFFHPDVPFEFIGKVWQIMAQTKHTYIILTKRPERILEFWDWTKLALKKAGLDEWQKGFAIQENVWLGISVEDQQTADERIPLLLQTPAVVRFISAEPLLENIIIPNISYRNIGPVCSSCSGNGYYSDNFKTPCPDCKTSGKNPTSLDWVICGGESGKNARPLYPDWVRRLRDQCKENGISFFMKQICDSKGRKIPFEDLPQDLQVREFPNEYK